MNSTPSKPVDFTRPQLRFSGLPACPLGRVHVCGIKIGSMGTYRPAPDLRRWPRVALVYTLSGEAEYIDGNGLRAALLPGDLLVVFPKFPQSFYPRDGSQWSEVFIDFDGPLIEPWIRTGLLDSTAPIYHLTPLNYWAQRIWEIQACGPHPTAEDSLQAMSKLTRLLADIASSRAASQSTTDERWLANARRVLETRSLKTSDLYSAAKQMDMSYDSFRQKFVRLAGVPPKKYVNRCVMDRACQMLLAGIKSEAIAAELGFSDEFHFSKRFRETIGIPPRAFRQLTGARTKPGRER